jgi:glyoxylase-like metal-dependent hydrolase (beta-lactamase superfamily II)
MPNYICVTCGTQYVESKAKPGKCRICSDDREYVGWSGQKWTTLEKMKRDGYRNVFTRLEPHLYQIATKPEFGIGQRAFLLQTLGGNILWECLSYIDDETVRTLNRLGGLRAIAISHPHFYSSMVEWGEEFDVSVYLNRKNKGWIMRQSSRIRLWSGRELGLFDSLELICLGGHFPGSSVLLWPKGAEGKGVILSGDTIYVVSDRRYVSFMHSYPNYIPLPAKTVASIAKTISGFKFDRIYSSFEGRVLKTGALKSIRSSAERYIAHMS